MTFPARNSRYRKQDRYRRHGSADIRIPDQTFTPKQHDLGQDCIQANQGRRLEGERQEVRQREPVPELCEHQKTNDRRHVC